MNLFIFVKKASTKTLKLKMKIFTSMFVCIRSMSKITLSLKV